MKRILISVLCLGWTSILAAGPIEDRAAAALGRKETIALLRDGKVTDSRTRLTASLPAGAPVAERELALGRQWVAVAFHLYARGEMEPARLAVAEALAVAATASRLAGIEAERSSFLANVGLLCERVLRDVSQAKAFYDAAVAVHPDSQYAKQLQRGAEDRLRRQAVTRRS